MRVYCSLAAANLIVLCSLIFTCGCQNEPAATKKPATPPQVAHTSPPEARALDVSDRDNTIEGAFKRDALVQNLFDQDEVGLATWEQDVPKETVATPKTLDLMEDSTLSLESGRLGNLDLDTRKADAILRKASKK